MILVNGASIFITPIRNNFMTDSLVSKKRQRPDIVQSSLIVPEVSYLLIPCHLSMMAMHLIKFMVQ